MADTNPIKKTDGERSELSRHGERDKVLVPSEIWGLLMILRAPLRRGSFWVGFPNERFPWERGLSRRRTRLQLIGLF